jgi:glycosyltransferase involved in cell wall biosynthesis
LEQHNQGKTRPDDHFIFTDAWNPTVIQLKYMSDLLGFNWTLHALWHAGSYDPQDFLGRLVGDKPWVRHAEKSFFHAFDHNYFATDFHIEMFFKNLFDIDAKDIVFNSKDKWVRTGWPMEYMDTTLTAYKNIPKRDLILFPHRIAPEKQVDIFRDMAKHLPQYEFVVCQDTQLTKQEYHTLLGQSKIVFSANLQETLGISCYEGALVDAIPMVPDRLSYSEMYYDMFKYPSNWTEDFEAYEAARPALCYKIIQYMNNHDQFKFQVRKQAKDLTDRFFSANGLLENIK